VVEPAAGPSGPGTVVMELGAGVGALILYTPAGLDGEEIEISRDGSAVYPGLPAGRYTIWRGHAPAAAVTVAGGQVSSCHWPG